MSAGPGPNAAPAPADDALAVSLRGFGPVGLLAFLVILAGNLLVVPLTALLVLAWAWRSRTPWRDLGFVAPRGWRRTVPLAMLAGAALKLLMKAIVMPLLGADPVNHAYHFVVGNPAALPGMLYAVIVGAGFGEETFFRGYLFERLGRLLGPRRWAKPAIVALTSALFAVAHLPNQGLPGAEQAAFAGLAFGIVFALTGRIWEVMVAHAAFDVVAVAILYWNLEERIAHLVFH